MSDLTITGDNSSGVAVRDSSGRLAFGGVLALIVAGLCLLACCGSVFGILAASAGIQGASSPNFRMSASMLIFYLSLGGFFGSVGVASFNARRWARALLLAGSWLWL